MIYIFLDESEHGDFWDWRFNFLGRRRIKGKVSGIGQIAKVVKWWNQFGLLYCLCDKIKVKVKALPLPWDRRNLQIQSQFWECWILGASKTLVKTHLRLRSFSVVLYIFSAYFILLYVCVTKIKRKRGREIRGDLSLCCYVRLDLRCNMRRSEFH